MILVVLITVGLLCVMTPIALAASTVTYGTCKISTLDRNVYSTTKGTLGTVAANGRPPWYNVTILSCIRFYEGIYLPADANYLFSTLKEVTSLVGFKNIDTTNAVNMAGMFENSAVLTSIDLSNFVTSNVTCMDSMFKGCAKVSSLDLSTFDTSAVQSASNMFSGCSSLKTITVGSSWSFEGATGSRISGMNFPDGNWKANTGDFTGRVYAAADVPSGVAAKYTKTTESPTVDVQIEVTLPLSVPLLVAGNGSIANAVFDIENETEGAAIRVSQVSFSKGSSVNQVASYGSVTTQEDTVGMRLLSDAGGSVDLSQSGQISLDAATWSIPQNGSLGLTLQTKIGGYGNLDPLAKTPIGRISYTFSVAQ